MLKRKVKFVTDILQFAVVLAIFYPVYYFWDTGKVDKFCTSLEPGITRQQLIDLADEENVKLIGPVDAFRGAVWHARIAAFSSFSDYYCEIKGIANKVVSIKPID